MLATANFTIQIDVSSQSVSSELNCRDTLFEFRCTDPDSKRTDTEPSFHERISRNRKEIIFLTPRL